MNFELTQHARESLKKRPAIRLEWIAQVLAHPDHVESDRQDSELEHRLGRIDAHEGRVLRVIVKKNTTPLLLITCYFDRKMRGLL